MTSSGVAGSGSAVAQAYAMGVEKLAQRELRRQGEASVALIQQAAAPPRPVGPEGQGSHINVIA